MVALWLVVLLMHWITTLISRSSLFLFHSLMLTVMRNADVKALFELGFFSYEELAYCSDEDIFSLYRQYLMFPQPVVEVESSSDDSLL